MNELRKRQVLALLIFLTLCVITLLCKIGF